MTPGPRRLVVFLATLVALVSGGAAAALAVGVGPDTDGDIPGDPPATAVLSPRRAPAVLHTLVAQTRLASRLRAVMGSLAPTSCGLVRADKSTLLSFKPDQFLMPASALKLTTAAAFLSEVGGTGRFTTEAVFAKPVDGVVNGALTLVGGGDPLLATNGYVASRKHPPNPATDVDKLVAQIAAQGVRRITGGIAVHDGRYDTERLVPSWRSVYVSNGDVGPIGALAINDGFSAYSPRLIASTDAAISAGEYVRAALSAKGVVVEGRTHRSTSLRRPSGAVVEVRSAPYGEVVEEMLRESDNNTAEILLKELAVHESGKGTRAAGVTARDAALRTLRVNAGAVQAIDGSGLDRSDRATCSALLATLEAAPGGYDIEDMLAVAGRTGTLNDRFTTSPLAGKLRAKTGSLAGVTALVGVTDPAATVKVRFAFISNGSFSDAEGKAIQDRLVAALATYPEAPPASVLAP